MKSANIGGRLKTKVQKQSELVCERSVLREKTIVTLACDRTGVYGAINSEDNFTLLVSAQVRVVSSIFFLAGAFGSSMTTQTTF